MKVQFLDNGEIIEFEEPYINSSEDYKNWSSDAIVNYMRNSATFISASSNKEYMLGYAQRAVISNNEDIRATCSVEFVKDLIEKGHIKILET